MLCKFHFLYQYFKSIFWIVSTIPVTKFVLIIVDLVVCGISLPFYLSHFIQYLKALPLGWSLQLKMCGNYLLVIESRISRTSKIYRIIQRQIYKHCRYIYLFIILAIATHKFVITFCIGLELVGGGNHQSITTCAYIIYMVTFILVSPFGKLFS